MNFEPAFTAKSSEQAHMQLLHAVTAHRHAMTTGKLRCLQKPGDAPAIGGVRLNEAEL